MRVQLQPAYVLHARAYRDTSLILDVLTPEHGRLSIVARGARRQRRGRPGGAELRPLVPLLISFSGRAEMKTLTGSELAGPAPQARGERLFSALYLNELLTRLLHRHDPHPRLFAAYAETLGNIATTADVETLLRRFELTLLDDLGYGIALDVDSRTGSPVDPRRDYRFEPGLGLVGMDTVAEGGGVPAYAGADLLAMARGALDGPARDTAKRLLRAVLASHLGPEPLRSRELFPRSAASRGRAASEPSPSLVPGDVRESGQ